MLVKFILIFSVLMIIGFSPPIFAENGTLKIIKNSNSDIPLLFNVTNFGPEEYSKIHSIEVVNGTGMTCPMVLPIGNYSLVEWFGAGVSVTGISCDGVTTGWTVGASDIMVSITAGSEVTCTFENIVNSTIYDPAFLESFDFLVEEPQCADSDGADGPRIRNDCFLTHLRGQDRPLAGVVVTDPELQQTRLWWTMNNFCLTYPDIFTKIFNEKILPPRGCPFCELKETDVREFQSSFPPLKQSKSGLNPEEIIAKKGNVLLISKDRTIPSSFSEKSAKVLTSRADTNWTYFTNR